MRLEELLRHRSGDAAPPFSRQRSENHRYIHMALMIRREDHWSLHVAQVVQSLNRDPREYPGEWKQKPWLSDGAQHAERERAIPRRELHGLGYRVARGGSRCQPLEIGD